MKWFLNFSQVRIFLGMINLRGPIQKFGQKLQFFLFAEKASSGMWEICPKI